VQSYYEPSLKRVEQDGVVQSKERCLKQEPSRHLFKKMNKLMMKKMGLRVEWSGVAGREVRFVRRRRR